MENETLKYYLQWFLVLILYNIFSMLSSCGFFFMNSLQMWFAVAIAFTLAKKEKGWAAFAGLVLFFTYTSGIGNWASLNGVTADTVTVDALVQSGMAMEEAMNYNALFTEFMGMFTYNMGMFSGLIVGVIASIVHNKFVDTTLPEMFGFFAGTKWLL